MMEERAVMIYSQEFVTVLQQPPDDGGELGGEDGGEEGGDDGGRMQEPVFGSHESEGSQQLPPPETEF